MILDELYLKSAFLMKVLFRDEAETSESFYDSLARNFYPRVLSIESLLDLLYQLVKSQLFAYAFIDKHIVEIPNFFFIIFHLFFINLPIGQGEKIKCVVLDKLDQVLVKDLEQ